MKFVGIGCGVIILIAIIAVIVAPESSTNGGGKGKTLRTHVESLKSHGRSPLKNSN